MRMKLSVFKGWKNSKYHIQYVLPEVRVLRDSFSYHPYVDITRDSERGIALQTIINKVIIKEKIGMMTRIGLKNCRDKLIEYEISEAEAKLLEILFELTFLDYKRKIWKNLAKLSAEEVKAQLTLLYLTK